MPEKFTPSNGTEGFLFEKHNCNKCIEENFCSIRNNAFFGEEPDEWTAEDILRPETWKCSEKKEK